MSWNVRGLGGAEKRRSVKEALRKSNAQVILLQETKLDATKSKFIQCFANSLNYEWDVIHARDSAGGLITMWKPHNFTVLEIIKEERFLGLLVNFSSSNQNCLIGNS